MANPAEDVRKTGGGMRVFLDEVIRHKWTLPISGIVVAVAFAALLNQMLALRLDFKSLPALPDLSPAPAPVPTAVRLSPAGMVPETGRPAPAPSATGAPSRSSLPIELLGTFVTDASANPPVRSVAILQMTSGQREISAVRKGNKWQGLELLAVERSRVLVRNILSGAQEYISSDALQVASSAAPVKTGRTAPSKPDSSGKLLLSRSEVNRAIDNNTNVIFSWVDVQPYAPGGVVQGFQMGNIKPRGKPFFNLLGFQEGDIVKRVNGVKMDSVEKAVGLWQELHGKEQVSFTIQRQGVDREVQIVFKP